MVIFGKKEKHAESLIHHHIEVVGDVVKVLAETVDDYCAERPEFKEKAALVSTRETDADKIRRDIEMTLYDGAFMPVERGDYVNLVEHVDKIANQSEAVAKFLLLTRPGLCMEAAGGAGEMMQATVRCYEHIPKMFLSFEDGREVMALAHKVEEERNVDQIFARVVRGLFKSARDLAQKLHCKLLLDRVAAISNRIEDASDRFGIIVAKRP